MNHPGLEIWEGFLEEVTRSQMLGGCQHPGREGRDSIVRAKHRAGTGAADH